MSANKASDAAARHHPFALGFISVDTATRAKTLLLTLLHFNMSADKGGPCLSF